MVTSGSLERKFKDVFSFMLSEQISDDDNFATVDRVLSQLKVKYFFGDDGASSGSEVLRVEVDEFEEYFFYHPGEVVSFDEVRFRAWTREAAEFCKPNSKHESFQTLFSSGLQYEAAVKSFLKFNYETEGLSNYLRNYPNVTQVLLPRTYPLDVQMLISELSERAVTATLIYLGGELAAGASGKRSSGVTKLEEITREPSFKNKRGVISFGIKNGQLAISASNSNVKAASYKSLVDRALENLKKRNTLQRIHNSDSFIGQLIEEYRREIGADSEPSVPKLWLIGQELESQLSLHRDQEVVEDALDKTDLILLNSFLTSHNLYLQSFDLTETLMGDIERSLLSYQRVRDKSKKIPWAILADLGRSQSVMEVKSADVVCRASEALQAGHETKGLIAIGLGLLRGALKQIGGLIIELSIRAFEKTAEEIGRQGLLSALKVAGMYQPMLLFVQNQASALFDLSKDVPNYFGWIRTLLDTLGLS